MTNLGKIVSVVLALVITVAIYGAYQYPKAQIVASSPANTTFGTAKIAAINMTPSSAAATSSSILNNDASDRFVTDAFVTCNGTTTGLFAANGGVVNWLWAAGTTTTSGPAQLRTGSFSSSDFAMLVQVSTSTTVSDAYTATSTYTQVYNRRWPTGTYMTFQPNATSTEVCQAGVHYIGL